MEYLGKVEKVIFLSLLFMMVLVVILSTFELGLILINDIITPPLLLLEPDQLLEIFGMFLLVLIGVELLDTIKMYLTQKVVHIEVVFTVAMIAIARKVIILDIKQISSLSLIGIASIIIALSVGFYLLKKKPKNIEKP